MGESSVDRLLAVSSPALGGIELSDLDVRFGSDGSRLRGLLERRNGFYAFESALHVLPSQTAEVMSVELWNDANGWREEYGECADGLLFFAEDVFGVQFALGCGGIGSFDPETGDVDWIADDLVSWAALVMDDYEFLTGYPIGHDWQATHGPLEPGDRLCPKKPFVFGGGFEIDNLYAVDAVTSMKARGHIADQLRDIPDGTDIRFVVGNNDQPSPRTHTEGPT